MAYIRKRGKNSYEIAVSCGYDTNGKKLSKTKNVRLDPKLTPKQAEKELQRLAFEFEYQVERGTYLDGGQITFAQFAERWIKDYAEKELAPKTVHGYKYLLTRIIPAVGHIKLQKLQPVHLMEFYENLKEITRNDTKYIAQAALQETLKEKGITTKDLADVSQMNERTIKGILSGKSTTHIAVQAISTALDQKIENLFTPNKAPEPLSDESIKHHHRLISSILTSAVQWQCILSNPAERVKPLRVEKKEAAHYDEDTTEKMLLLLDNEPLKYKTMIYITVYSGCRLGELTALEWSDVDFEHNLMRVRQSAQYISGQGTFTKTPKNDSSYRVISMPPVVMGLLKQYKIWQNEERLKCGNLWQDNNRLFTQWNGLPIHPSTPSKWFKSFRERHNLPELKFHGLRHTNATLLISQGVDIQTVAKRLGHAKPTTTTTVYSHFLRKPDQEAAEKLENLFGKNKKVGMKQV